MKKTLLTAVLVLAALAAGYALGRRSVAPGLLSREEARGPAVATFRGGAVTRADVEAALAKQPAAFREQLRTLAARKALVEELVRFELFAREGERKGYERDPEFLRRYKDELGRRFVEKELDEPERKAPPSDAVVRAFYDEHKAALGRPERVRVAVVQYAAATGDAAGAAKRSRADAALARLRKEAKDPAAFARTAQRESEEPLSRLSNGELPFLTRDELGHRLGPEVADAAFSISATGQLAASVVESARGFHLVRLLGREDGYQPAFEEMKEAIRARLGAEHRAVAYEAFLKALFGEAAVKLDEKAIEALKLD